MKDVPGAKRGVPVGHSAQNGCFGCGRENRSGLQLRFYSGDDGVICEVKLPRRFMGPPGYAHGGIIATLLDEAMSKANRLREVFAMTRQLNVEYLRPVPLETPLVLLGFSEAGGGRKHRCHAELRDATSRVLASGRGLFIEVKAERLVHGQQRPE